MHRTTTIVPGWQTRSAIKLCDVCCNDDNKTKFYHLQVPVAQRTTWPGPERCWMTPKLAATAPLIPQWARASSAVLVPPSQKVQNEWSKWQLSASRGCTWPGRITGCGEKVRDKTRRYVPQFCDQIAARANRTKISQQKKDRSLWIEGGKEYCVSGQTPATK